jgi:hypothetical protein
MTVQTQWDSEMGIYHPRSDVMLLYDGMDTADEAITGWAAYGQTVKALNPTGIVNGERCAGRLMAGSA